MRILIVGAGVVGANLAEQLSVEGHEVSIVDNRAEVVERLVERLDLLAVEGDGADPAVLERARISAAELVIAVTDHDHRNMIVALLAEHFGARRRIARVRQPFAAGIEELLAQRLGISRLIHPEQEVVRSVVKLVQMPGSIEVADFAEGEIALRGFTVAPGSALCDLRLSALRGRLPEPPFLVALVLQQDKLVIPSGRTTLRAGDRIFAVLAKPDLPAFLPHVGVTPKADQRIVIGSASATGVRLAAALEAHRGHELVLIEPDRARCEAATRLLSRTRVLHGAPTDLALLAEAGAAEADHFIAVADEDEANLMAALLARKAGAHKVVVQSSAPETMPILDSLGFDATVNPRLLTVAAILRDVRRGRVVSMVKVGRGEAEAIEYELLPSSPLAGKPLEQIKLPAGSLLGAVSRGGQTIIPDGRTVLQEGDRALVFALPEAVSTIETMFARVRPHFFKLFGG